VNDPRANDDECLLLSSTAARTAGECCCSNLLWGEEIRFEAFCAPTRPRMGRVAVLVRRSMAGVVKSVYSKRVVQRVEEAECSSESSVGGAEQEKSQTSRRRAEISKR
jgi:hypothetical protein